MGNNESMHVRNIALIGSYLSGKTTLLESLLYVTGAISRKGRVQDGNSVSDATPESRERQMSVEVSVADATYRDVRFTFLDCPGSSEFLSETYNVLPGIDAAVVVCEPEVAKAASLAPLLKFLDHWQIPHLLFVNKMDRARDNLNDLLAALQAVSNRPLALQQYPVDTGEGLSGFVDLIDEQAYRYHPGAPADPIELPAALHAEEHAARAHLLEVLADFDDHLLEELVEEVEPSVEEITQNLQRDLQADLIVPVLIGVAERDFGVRPLLEALHREAAPAAATAARYRVAVGADGPLVQVLKTTFTPGGGKLSLARIWRGTVSDGMTLDGGRVGGLYRLFGAQQQPVQTAGAGEIVALGRLEGVRTGAVLGTAGEAELPQAWNVHLFFDCAATTEKRSDEVKLTQVTGRLLEEDPSLGWEQNRNTRELLLWGQGEVHLAVTLDRLRRKFNLPLVRRTPQVPYKETITATTLVHGRYKHQTGGHGQFGDVWLAIRPLSRGEGIQFRETIVGGSVPRQYIPGVEAGVREYLERGPLGYEVVDVEVTLTNGTYHSVDSSEQAFRQAARLAMQEGMPKCRPILLEPILQIEVFVPNDTTSRVLRLLNGQRAQILGYDARPDWQSWDQISAYLPQSQMQQFVVELRSLTCGLGTFEWRYDHLQEAPDKLSERVLTPSNSKA